MITKADVKDFFDKLESEAEADAEKIFAAAGRFLRSTLSALAKDPALTSAVQAAFSGGLAQVALAVETNGASVLPSVCKDVAVGIMVGLGKTAEHELVPIVQGELHAAYAPTAAAIPEKANN